MRRFGAGSGAVRTIAGTMSLHEELERRLAEFKNVEAVLTFQSGFTANTGVIPVIAGEGAVIVSDALNHASIIDGIRLTKAERKVFPHADMDGLRAVLAEVRAAPGGAERTVLVITDGVFSMDGDIARLPEIVEAAEAAEAIVYVDDAHASGVLGRNGRGTRRPLRPARPGARPGRDPLQGDRRAGRLRGGQPVAARGPDPSRAAVPLLDLRTRRPWRPPAWRRSTCWSRSRS